MFNVITYWRGSFDSEIGPFESIEEAEEFILSQTEPGLDFEIMKI